MAQFKKITQKVLFFVLAVSFQAVILQAVWLTAI